MRKGDWIETYTGKQFWPLDPRPAEVDIEDIAHALSNLCRYNGHCKHFFSVGQHSINCARYALRMGYSYRIALLALLHDAAEAYVSDVSKPIKPFLKGFDWIEYHTQQAIYKALEVHPPAPKENEAVKEIDCIMLVTEAQVLMPFNGWGEWVDAFTPCPETEITTKPNDVIKELFIGTYHILKLRGRVASGGD